MSSSNCCFLTCIQISQETGQVVWYSYLFQNFPQFIVIHTIKSFGVVNKAEIDIFLELSCFLTIQRMLAIWSLIPLPFRKLAWTYGILRFTKPVNQKQIDWQTFLQQRWVHSGFAENYNLSSSTLQIPTRQREENVFIEKERKLGGRGSYCEQSTWLFIGWIAAKNGKERNLSFPYWALLLSQHVRAPPSGLF